MVIVFLLLVMRLFALPIFMCRLFLMYLDFTCSSFPPTRLLIMVVMSLLILTFVLFSIIVPRPWLVLAVGSVILLVSGSLIVCIFLQFPLRTSRFLLLMPLLLLPLLPPALLGDIII
jgi:hypothetical protein